MSKKYRYKEKVIGVYHGLGGTFIVGWLGPGGCGAHRLKVRTLPVCDSQEEAQIRLNGWAKAQKLQEVEGSDNG